MRDRHKKGRHANKWKHSKSTLTHVSKRIQEPRATHPSSEREENKDLNWTVFFLIVGSFALPLLPSLLSLTLSLPHVSLCCSQLLNRFFSKKPSTGRNEVKDWGRTWKNMKKQHCQKLLSVSSVLDGLFLTSHALSLIQSVILSFLFLTTKNYLISDNYCYLKKYLFRVSLWFLFTWKISSSTKLTV